MIRKLLILSLCSLILCGRSEGSPLAEASLERSSVPWETQCWKSLQEKKESSIQNKKYHAVSSGDDKQLSCQKFPASRGVSTSSYTTSVFSQTRNFFLSEKKYQLIQAEFPKKECEVLLYQPVERAAANNLPAKKVFPTRAAALAPQAQEALDQNSFLKQATKKHLSIEEVKELLSKTL